VSQENIAAVRAAYEQFSRGDFSTVFAGLSEDFEFVTAAEMPDAGTYRGDEARDWMKTYVESFDGFTMEATEIIDSGDKVVAAIVQRARVHGSEMPIESRW
jgi:ketosteroid isomerase-like protein